MNFTTQARVLLKNSREVKISAYFNTSFEFWQGIQVETGALSKDFGVWADSRHCRPKELHTVLLWSRMGSPGSSLLKSQQIPKRGGRLTNLPGTLVTVSFVLCKQSQEAFVRVCLLSELGAFADNAVYLQTLSNKNTLWSFFNYVSLFLFYMPSFCRPGMCLKRATSLKSSSLQRESPEVLDAKLDNILVVLLCIDWKTRLGTPPWMLGSNGRECLTSFSTMTRPENIYYRWRTELWFSFCDRLFVVEVKEDLSLH